MIGVQEPSSNSTTHVWVPITDLADADLAARSEELHLLADVWQDEHRALPDDRAVKDFNERLQREWVIETGIIEPIHSLDRRITQLPIERGIDASLIANDAMDQPPELVARIIRDQESAIDFLFDFVAQRRDLTGGFIKAPPIVDPPPRDSHR